MAAISHALSAIWELSLLETNVSLALSLFLLVQHVQATILVIPAPVLTLETIVENLVAYVVVKFRTALSAMQLMMPELMLRATDVIFHISLLVISVCLALNSSLPALPAILIITLAIYVQKDFIEIIVALNVSLALFKSQIVQNVKQMMILGSMSLVHHVTSILSLNRITA